MKTIRQLTLILIAAFLWNPTSFGQSQYYGGNVTLLPLTGETITVTTLFDVTDFSGAQRVEDLPGPDGRVSFREAVIAANNTPGPQTIAFAIPVSEFWLLPDVALLKLEDGAFFLRDAGTTVDFSTQTINIGDTNPDGTTRQQIGFEIVDVFKQVNPNDLTAELGDRLLPPPPASSVATPHSRMSTIRRCAW